VSGRALIITRQKPSARLVALLQDQLVAKEGATAHAHAIKISLRTDHSMIGTTKHNLCVSLLAGCETLQSHALPTFCFCGQHHSTYGLRRQVGEQDTPHPPAPYATTQPVDCPWQRSAVFPGAPQSTPQTVSEQQDFMHTSTASKRQTKRAWRHHSNHKHEQRTH
jgi:hypothetical protein